MLKVRALQLALSASVVAVLVGCGSYPLAPQASSPETSLSMQVAQTGSLKVRFASAYTTQASIDDIVYISVTISGSNLTYPLNQNLKWPLSKEAVFGSLPAGKYTVKVEALDKYFDVIGSASQSDISVTAGQVTPLAMKLGLTGAGSNGSISLDVSIDTGVTPTPGPSATPTPGPTATPTPAPTATPTPGPTATPAAGVLNDNFESGFSKWVASWTKASYSTDTAASTAWNASTYAANGGTHAASAGGTDGMVLQTGTYTMTLAAGVNLAAVAAPVLRYDLANFQVQNYFKTGAFMVDVSTDGGTTWTLMHDQTASQTAWQRYEIDLTSFKSANTKVRFRFVYDYYLGSDKFIAPTLDNVYLGAQ